MKRYLAAITLALSSLALFGCASTPKIALSPEKKQSIKRIAIVEVAEPEKYFVNPGQVAGGQALYMFGALGGAILGGIEASRMEAATARFMTAAASLKPSLSNSLTLRLEQGLKAKGYEVIRTAQPPKQNKGDEYDLSNVGNQVDAVLIPTLSAGYNADGKKVAPMVQLGMALYARSNTEKLFADTYVYGTHAAGTASRIEPHTEFVMSSVDALYNDISLPIKGLKTGVETLADKALTDL